MADRKERSRFWVVSTHVLTTGFAMPLLGALLGVLVGMFLPLGPLTPLVSILSLLGFLALGYAGGAFYSLSYIRKSAVVQNPRSCIVPSIIAFAVLALAACAGFAVLTGLGILFMALVLPYFLLIIGCFSVVTWYGFNRMAEQQADAAEE